MILNRIKALLHTRAKRSASGVAEHECRDADVALAMCVDYLRPDIERVEVRIGRDLAARTNPEKLKLDVHHAARSFVRDGRTTYALSVGWADVLDRQDRVFVKAYPRSAPSSASPRRSKPGDREVAAIRREIAEEFAFALAELIRKSGRPAAIESICVVCRDARAHEWLFGVAQDEAAFSRALKSLAEKHVPVTPDFRSSYRFESELPSTAAVGQGLVAIELAAVGAESKPRPPLAAVTEMATPAMAGTFEISDEPASAPQSQVKLTFVGLGREIAADEAAVCLDLPASINRRVLAATSLSNDADHLRTVSESNPLRVAVKDGRLCLSANARRSRDGSDRPGYFVVDGDREIPIVGERVVPAEVEVLIGSESHRSGRTPAGKTLRPPRIRLVLGGENRPT